MPGIKDAKCVLVIGATAGLGRSLALAIHDLDTQPTVIVGGRRQERLDELAKSSSRIKTVRVDINTSQDNLKAFVNDILAKYPEVIARSECMARTHAHTVTVGCNCAVVWYSTYLRFQETRVDRLEA